MVRVFEGHKQVVVVERERWIPGLEMMDGCVNGRSPSLADFPAENIQSSQEEEYRTRSMEDDVALVDRGELAKSKDVEDDNDVLYAHLANPPSLVNSQEVEVVNTDIELTPLRDNATVAQIKLHGDEGAKRYNAMSYIQNGISDVIFTRIMACKTPKQAWDKLKKEFQGSDKTKQQQLINLRRDFENLKMKEAEIVK
ncbi:hypothetical protein PVK06_001697 [Gossypium arboreum]|uniref:Uncharacterized protein n=1 Tax=Gossypium arboreum TaxID=29729 RepID=A0ABR0R1W0_GOSAR|nr:hypothetical protein PVK06_001697 [Gossypium arboreum]